MVAAVRHRRVVAALLGAVLLAACAPAVSGDAASVRPYRLQPLDPAQRYVIAVYDIEAEPTRVDVGLLPARERDARLFTDLGRGIGDIVTRELFDLGRFDLVERRNLQAALDEQDLGATGRFDAGTVRQSIVAIALRNAIRDAVEAAALGLPPRR